jgi:integrator complex subunit 3
LKEAVDALSCIVVGSDPQQVKTQFNTFLEQKNLENFNLFFTEFESLSTIKLEEGHFLFEAIVNFYKSKMPEKLVHPEEVSVGELEHFLENPIFALFKNLYENEDKCKKPILSLLQYVQKHVPTAGCMLLYYLKSYAKMQTKSFNFKKKCYELFYGSSDLNMGKALAKDLTMLKQLSSSLLSWILPDIYREFKHVLVNNSEVLRIVVCCIDAKNFKDLIYNVIQGKLLMLEDYGVLDVIRSSFDFETFEQFYFWQLVQAHDIPFDTLKVIN